jgi:hypothetical protein
MATPAETARLTTGAGNPFYKRHAAHGILMRTAHSSKHFQFRCMPKKTQISKD